MWQPRRFELSVNWEEFPQRPCWQGICVGKCRQILVALKRNDEYALDIKTVQARQIYRAF